MTEPTLFGSEEARARGQAAVDLSKNPRELVKAANLDVDSTTEAKILARVDSMPRFCRATYLRAMRGRSKGSAIKAFCQMCVCWERKEVALCTDPACPVYPYRPYVEHNAVGPEEPEESEADDGPEGGGA